MTRALAAFAVLAMMALGCGRSDLSLSGGDASDAAFVDHDAASDGALDEASVVDAPTLDGPAFDSPGAMLDAAVPASGCNATTCSGCCSTDGTCVQDEMSNACGAGGQPCEACPVGDFCGRFLACVHWVADCNPLNCAGCCMTSLLCSTGLSNQACGQNGGLCQVIFPRFGGRSDYAANAAICDLNSNSIGLT